MYLKEYVSYLVHSRMKCLTIPFLEVRMKKFIIVTLIAGFLTAQAPVQALKMQNTEVLATTAAATEITQAHGADALKKFKAVCAQTSKLRTAVKWTLVCGGGIAAVTAMAIYLGYTPEYLLSLIDAATMFAHSAIDTGTECVIPCIDGFINTGNQCVEQLTTATATPIVTMAAECSTGFINTGSECVIPCAGDFINTGSQCIVGNAVAVTTPACAAAETIASAVQDTLLTLPATGSEVEIFNFNDVTQQSFNNLTSNDNQLGEAVTAFTETIKNMFSWF